MRELQEDEGKLCIVVALSGADNLINNVTQIPL